MRTIGRNAALRTIVSVVVAAGVISASGAGPAVGRDALEPGQPVVAHRDGGRPVDQGDRPRLLVSRTAHTSGEPTLGVTKRGEVFLSAVQDGIGVDVLRSGNGGRSWNVVSPRLGEANAHPVSLDPYVYVDQDTQRVFTIDLTVACSYLSFTEDRGESWVTNPLACGRPVNDHQTLFSGPPATSQTIGYENVLYYCWNDVASSSCSKSIDGGLTFRPTGSPAFSGIDTEEQTSDFCGGLHGHGVVDRKGTVYLPREYCNSPYLAISKDEGATWTLVAVSAMKALSADPSVDTDPLGNVYYAWIGPKQRPYLTISRDGGESWSRPMMIAAPGVQRANLVTLDVDAPGEIALAYMGTADPKHPTTWNGYITVSSNVLADDPLFWSGAVNPERDPFKLGACGPGRCGLEVLDFIDVAIARDGSAWAAFVDACDQVCIRNWEERGNEGVVGNLLPR